MLAPGQISMLSANSMPPNSISFIDIIHVCDEKIKAFEKLGSSIYAGSLTKFAPPQSDLDPQTKDSPFMHDNEANDAEFTAYRI